MKALRLVCHAVAIQGLADVDLLDGLDAGIAALDASESDCDLEDNECEPDADCEENASNYIPLWEECRCCGRGSYEGEI